MKINMLYNSMLAFASDGRGINEILTMLQSEPSSIELLTNADKTLLILFVSGLGMAVTFAVLLFLWFCIVVLTAVMKSASSKKTKPSPLEQVKKTEQAVQEVEEDEELIAVIAAAVAASLNTSIHNIVVRNIVSVNDHSPSWAKTGRIEQMNTRF